MTDFPPGEFPPPQRPKSKALWIILPLTAFAAVVVFAAFAAGAFLLLQRNGVFARPRPRAPEESLAEKRQANAEAFGQGAVESDASPEELDAFLLLLKRTARIKTPEEAEDCFDVKRLFEEIIASVNDQQPLRAPGVFEAFRGSFTKRFAERSLLTSFIFAEIKRVKFVGGREDAVVFSQHRTAEGIGMKMRWWVGRSGGKWKIYDFEDLEMGVRSSVSMAAVMDSAGKQGFAPRQAEALTAVSTAMGFLMQQQFDLAEQQILPTLDVPLPKAMAAWRLAQLAIVETSRTHWAEVLDLLDRAATFNPEMPLLPMLRAQALNGQGRFEEAAADARKYIAELGGDDHGSFLLGTALAGMGKKPEAADAFREGLDAYSDSVDNLVGLAGVLSDAEMEDIADRFARFQNPSARFVDVASQLIANENAAALAALVRCNRERSPRDPHNDYVEGELRWMRQEYEQAAESFRSALPQMSEAERVDCQKALRNSLLYAGKPVEAYQSMPDGDDTFLAVFNRLVTTGDAEGLEQVASLHAERQPDDAWLPYFRGEAMMLRGQYREAADAFRPMLKEQLSAEQQASYRDEYLAAEINAGRPLEGYQAVPDAAVAFKLTADALINRWNADALERLVAAHAERMPDDRQLPYYRARSLMMRSRYDEAAELTAPLVAAAEDEELKVELAEVRRAALAYGGKPLEAYATSIDRDVAFERTAAYLAEELDDENLAALVARREADQPDAPATLYYKARRSEMAGDYRAVAELLRPAAASAEGDERDRMVELLLDALYETGDFQAAREAVRPDEAFVFLAPRLANSGDDEALETLIAAYEPHAAGDPRWLYYRGRVAQLRGRGDEAAEAFSAWFKAASSDDDDGETLDEYLGAMADSRRALEAYSPAADAGLAFQTLASELAWRGDGELLETLVDARAKDEAGDPWIGYWRGRALLMRGKEEEALAAYESALKAAASADVEGLIRAVRDEYSTLGRPLEGYALSADAVAAFADFGGSLWRARDLKRLRQLVAAHEPKHPDDPCLAWLKGELLIADGKYDEAAELLSPRLADDDAPYAFACKNAHRKAIIKNGRALDAYRSAEDRTTAFVELASALEDAADAAGLSALVDAHREAKPDDPWLHYYAAQRLRLTREYDEADRAFAAALSAPGAAAIRSSLVEGRILARFEAGKAVSAYEEIGPRLATLDKLIELCDAKQDAAQWEQLIAAHRKRYPNDARIAEWELDVADAKRDYETLERLLEQRPVALKQSSRWKLPPLRVRMLLKQNRIDDARALIESQQQFRPAPVDAALVEATAGNVPAACTALYQCLRSGFGIQQVYEDPELGAALRTDAFAAFRERHPEAPADPKGKGS